MRRSHYYLAGVALATFGLIVATPTTAQEAGPPPGDAPIDQVAPDTGSAPTLTPDQQAQYDGWEPDQKFGYDSWPAATQEYYWSLAPDEQMLFWRLTDEDKIAITAMTGPERDSAWETIKNSAQGSGDSADAMPPPPSGG
ncbi:hypothetical protein [Erythrobacter ani]|uniref:Uncharacterized protein n=1 Tax=Erythrobacter ani TaxID=2827235 RepID=A0ABS6SP45_9SPHN|nr:hypothetical protein [Erythrobacter ani]MBV7266803.1 hypothetical protein [Erythrobacter ani]